MYGFFEPLNLEFFCIAKMPGFFVVVDNRTGDEFLIFEFEKDLVDEAHFSVMSCDYVDFVELNRKKKYLGVFGR